MTAVELSRRGLVTWSDRGNAPLVPPVPELPRLSVDDMARAPSRPAEDVGLPDDTDSSSSDEGPDPWSIRGNDGRQTAPGRDEEGAWSPDADRGLIDRTIDAEIEEESERSGTVEAIARSRSFRGPLPPVAMIEGYERVVPGSAEKIVDAHVANEHARAGALTRLTRAESVGVIVGAIGSQLLAIGGLAAGVVLIVQGFPAESLLGFVPAVISSGALVVSAVRGSKVD